MPDPMPTPAPRRSLLDTLERIGNALPEPAMLFVLGALFVMGLSQVADHLDWSVQKPTLVRAVENGQEVLRPGEETVHAVGLLTRDGLDWVLSSMVANFTNFAPLGIVLVAMLGIGVAEKTGAIAALLKAMMLVTPQRLLTPTIVFVGVNSNLASDAGYVVLPPIAAALYKSVGRSPLVGIAAVFAGIAGGFSANLVISGTDVMLAGLTHDAARIFDPAYQVDPTCNYYFMAVSTIFLTFVGWFVTARIVEPRLARKSPEDGGPPPATEDHSHARLLSAGEVRGLNVAGLTLAASLAAALALILIPGAPLHGLSGDGRRARWVVSIVPLLFFLFLAPGIAYGLSTGALRAATPSGRIDRGIAKLMGQTMADMGPYIVLAFFAAQFIEYFKHSNLGVMLAVVGGRFLAEADIGTIPVLVGLILITLLVNLFIGSASAKYAFFAPVFVPMFMGPGISPELTQAAYRVGDSVTNVVAPMNPYLIVILVFMQKHMAKAGVGTLVSLMLPYSVVFAILWTALLIAWVLLGIPLGPGAPLHYPSP